jgi:hypothetical protein
MTMLFRPSFCCNCGERIDRAEWSLWHSRRFCDLCKTTFPVQEVLPKALVLLSALVLVVGAVNYFAGGPGRRELAMTRPAGLKQMPEPARPADQAAVPESPANVKPVSPPAVPVDDRNTSARTQTMVSPANPVTRSTPEAAMSVYYCGAETKKGTPCSRKVKGNVRCWQHAGMPAMLPPDKLLVSR